MSYDKIWRSEFYNNVSASDRMKDFNLNRLKLKVTDIYRKDEEITTNFHQSDDNGVMNKAFLDAKVYTKAGHLLIIEKSYNEFVLQSDKRSGQAFFSEKAVKTIIQILYDQGLIDKYKNANEVLKNFLPY